MHYSKEGSRIEDTQDQQHDQDSSVKCMAIHTPSTLTSSGSMSIRMLPITIKIHAASVNLNPTSTIGWDSYAGVTVSCVKENFLYLVNDGPLIQSGLTLEGLGNTTIKPTQEGPLC